MGTENATALEARVKAVEDDLNASSLQLKNSSSLLTLINNAHTKINSLIDGTIPVELQYNTNVIFSGIGTAVDKSIAGKIKVNNTVNGYSLAGAYKWDIASSAVSSRITVANLFEPSTANVIGVWTKLVPFSNRLSLKNIIDTGSFSGNLNIYIDDSTNGWSNGQVLKIALDNITINGNNIKIWTGKATSFNKLIADIDPSQLITTAPYIEVVCVNSANYVFEADILR
jgi:hypothetical protein